MARRIAILLLVSSALLYQEIGPAAEDDVGRAPAFVAADVAPNDAGAWGECPWPQPDTDRRNQGVVAGAVPKHGSAAARRTRNDSPKRGLGPVLSALSDSLTLSRPPPAVRGAS